MKRYKTQEESHFIKIYKNNSRKAFCEIQVPSIEYFHMLLDNLNSNEEYVLFGQLIFDRKDFSHATFE